MFGRGTGKTVATDKNGLRWLCVCYQSGQVEICVVSTLLSFGQLCVFSCCKFGIGSQTKVMCPHIVSPSRAPVFARLFH